MSGYCLGNRQCVHYYLYLAQVQLEQCLTQQLESSTSLHYLYCEKNVLVNITNKFGKQLNKIIVFYTPFLLYDYLVITQEIFVEYRHAATCLQLIFNL